jgi:hypothetical protein
MGFKRVFAPVVLAMCLGMAAFALPASAVPYSNTFSTAGPIDISGSRGKTTADLFSSNREVGEPSVAGSNTDHTIWWRYTSAVSGLAKFSTCRAAGANPVPGLSLGVYTGSTVSTLTTIGCRSADPLR